MSLRSLPSATEPRDDADLGLDAAATTRILTGFIATELRRTGRDKLVLGLSGGIDSSLAAFLAVAAVGREAVVGLRLPYRTSAPASLGDAQCVIDMLGIAAETVDLSGMVDAFAQVSGTVDRVRLGNVMSRLRMIVLYDRSARHDALVLGSSNKTELLLGYATVHGDLASAINPLGDLYKTQVRALARHLGVPEPILAKPPSADLWPDQSDEAELGLTYDRLDRLLALLVDARVSRETAVARGFPEELVSRVVQRIVRSQFKRRPPVMAKVSTRSVGWDFLYPRDWST